MSGSGIDVAELEREIAVDRMVELTRRLVAIRSYSGEEAAVADAYAESLHAAGAQVELEPGFSGSPSVVARIGAGNGPTLNLAGHLDTIPAPDEGPDIREGRIYGRGSCDMKAGLAVIVEVLQVLKPFIDQLPLRLMVTAYGLHEGPGAGPMHSALHDLFQKGLFGDAVFVCEGPTSFIPIAGKGSMIFKLRFNRQGIVEHEILHQGDIPNPVMAAHEFVSRLRVASEAWGVKHPLLGSESYFIGAINGGDLYNRIAVEAVVDGTRRYPPPRTFQEVTDEFSRIGAEVEQSHGVRFYPTYERSGQPFELDPSDPLVRILQRSCAEVMQRELPLMGQIPASDMNHFVVDAGVLTVSHGVDASRAHATPEFVEIKELVRFARVLLRTLIGYSNDHARTPTKQRSG